MDQVGTNPMPKVSAVILGVQSVMLEPTLSRLQAVEVKAVQAGQLGKSVLGRNRAALALPPFRHRPAKAGLNAPKHFRARSLQCAGKIHDGSKRWALLAALQLAYVGRMITAFKRQRFLRESPLFPDVP